MAWKPLHLSASASNQLPAFLISASFGSSSYSIHLTDLTHIWSESLQRRDIIRRSQEENTSIDPSDSEQLQILLQKIELGLTDDKDTTASSALSICTDDERPRLILNLTVALPGGLAALQWPIRLDASPQFLLTSQLTLPLLEAQHARMQEMMSLAEVLKEKDHVIQKLLDKLEAQGTELGEVFPQAAGKAGRKVDRKKAEERVKGLAQFDIHTWRGGLNTDASHDAGRLISEVFDKNGVESPAIKAQGGSANAASGSEEVGWWEEIRGITVNLQTGKISTSFSKPNLRDSKAPPKKNEKPLQKAKPPKAVKQQQGSETDDDDAFQVQDTPPGKKSKTIKPEPHPSRDSPNPDDDDLGAPSQRSKIPDSFSVSQPLAVDFPSPPPPKTKAPGKIGGKKKSPPPPVEEDGSTEDDSPPLRKPTRKIGAIGGKKSTPKPPVGEEGSTEDETSPLRVKKSSPVVPPPEDGSTEDEATPPPKQSSKVDKIASKSNAHDDNDETSTEDDAASPPTKSPPKATELAPSKTKKGMLGKIGGKKELPKAPTPEPPEVGPEPEPEPVAIKPKKGKLGKIGGKKNQAAPTVPQPSGTPPPASQVDTSTPKKKLGMIGGKKIKDEPSPEKEERGRGMVKEEREKTPEARETSAERAEKKRAALKRELEVKKSAPVKKKRKF
ncbi:XRCC4-like factor-domain-containing protein [Halenospora varia]|nr:XRCC4-like factor-domain-containing protein [Halenospora varia]